MEFLKSGLSCEVVSLNTVLNCSSPSKNSYLSRKGIYRVNMGIRKKTFTELFGAVPKRPSKGGIVDMNYDFTTLDKILPHPVYAWMA